MTAFLRQARLSGRLPRLAVLLPELEASADEPGAVALLWEPPYMGCCPEGPRLLVKTAEMRGSVGALGPPGQTFVLSWSPGLLGDKEEPRRGPYLRPR